MYWINKYMCIHRIKTVMINIEFVSCFFSKYYMANFSYINKRNLISSVFHFLQNHSYQFTYYYFDFCIANTTTQSLVILPSLRDPPWPFCSHQPQPARLFSNVCSPQPSYSININYKDKFIISIFYLLH